MSDPFIHWYTSDFLNACVDLECEVVGAYTIILNLMADKGGPIDDDPRWLARRCNLTTTRMRRIRNHLVESGKLSVRNGMLGNAKMLREIRRRDGKSNQASDAAKARWKKYRAENKPQLPFEENFSSSSPQGREQKPAEKTPKNMPKSAQKKPEKKQAQKSDISQTSANLPTADASRLARAAEPEPEYTLQTNESLKLSARENSDSVDRSLDMETDLVRLFETVSAEAGWVPRGATGYANGIEQVREWRDTGISFELTVLPAIRSTIAESAEPTGSLKRFDQKIRHEHARSAARKTEGLAPSLPAEPPADPILEFSEEDFDMIALRRDLLAAIGQRPYVDLCHRLRFLPNDDYVDKKPRLAIYYAKAVKWTPLMLDGATSAPMRAIALKHGFVDVLEERKPMS